MSWWEDTARPRTVKATNGERFRKVADGDGFGIYVRAPELRLRPWVHPVLFVIFAAAFVWALLYIVG